MLESSVFAFRPWQPRSQTAGWALCTTVILLLRFALFFASKLTQYASDVSLWFPASAATFAAFLVFGRRAAPALLVAAIVCALYDAGGAALARSPATVLGGAALYGLVHCLCYALLAAGVARTVAGRVHPSLSATIGAFLVGGLPAALLSAIGGVLASRMIGLTGASGFHTLMLTWMLGDYVGLLVMGPLLAYLLRRVAEGLGIAVPEALYAYDALHRMHQPQGRYLPRQLGLLLLVAASLVLIARERSYSPLIFVVFIAIMLQLWLAIGQRMLQSMVSVAAFSMTQVVVGYFLSLDSLALLLQCATITLAAGTYYATAVPMLYAYNERLRGILTTDALTGAHSRMFFVELSEQALRQAHAAGLPTSMLMIDMDHLKSINDSHGHLAGDRALSSVVSSCRAALSPGDLIGRLGGDEFCVLLPGRDGDAAAAIAERMRTLVSAARNDFASGYALSVSIGIATTRRDAPEDYDSLCLRADSALYVAKRLGRNRLAQEDGETAAP